MAKCREENIQANERYIYNLHYSCQYAACFYYTQAALVYQYIELKHSVWLVLNNTKCYMDTWNDVLL